MKYGKQICLLLLLNFFLLIVVGCGGSIDSALEDFLLGKREPNLSRCFRDFAGWKYPERVEGNVKRILCLFLEAHPELEFHFHSGWRAKEALVHPHHSPSDKSQHPAGKAVDCHFSNYDGMTRCQIMVQFKIDGQKFETWLIIEGYDDGGLGKYPQWATAGFHYDTFGLGPGEFPKKRRWCELNGEYVEIERCDDFVDEYLAKKCNINPYPRM